MLPFQIFDGDTHKIIHDEVAETNQIVDGEVRRVKWLRVCCRVRRGGGWVGSRAIRCKGAGCWVGEKPTTKAFGSDGDGKVRVSR